MFESILGITAANPDALRRALLETAAMSDEAKPRGGSTYGTMYTVRFALTTAAGTATVLSVWIIRNGADFPRLTTCYIV